MRQISNYNQKIAFKFGILQYQYNSINMSFVFKPSWQSQGVGAKVIRVIGNQYLRRLDPFLMLDHFKVRLPAGFPDHPHRGFETVTYMQQGVMYHEDFKGHKGTIGPGDIQWMTAGKGIVHAEMPGSTDHDSIGFQLWLNLKSKDKMQEPQYQQYTKDQIPIYEKDGTKVKIICGQWQGHTGPIKYHTPSYYMDIKIPKDGKFEIPIKSNWNSIVYLYEGEAQYSCKGVKHQLKTNDCCVLEKSKGEDLIHALSSKTGAGFMLVSGEPINEPVVNYGPFVMNTQQQIEETFEDYQKCRNGFENRGKWASKIRDLSKGKKFSQL